MKTRIRGLVTLLALIALMAGVPYALARVGGRPWPHPFPSIDVIVRSLRSGDISDGAVLKALAIVMWIAWARLAISIALEVVSRLAGAHVPRVIGLGRAQHWAAALVATVVLVAGVSPRPSAAAPWSPNTALPRPIAAGLLEDHSTPVSLPLHLPGEAGEAVRRDQPAPAPDTTVHIVQRHESFWSIAEDTLGDGARWREIVAMNAGREVAPGIVFSGSPDRLLPGWQLLVPAHASGATASAAIGAAPNAPAMTEAHHLVVVAPGDTLSAIADDELGDANRWPLVWEANRDRHFANRVFDDPDLILPGWELIVPDVLAPPTSPAVADLPPPPVPAAVPAPSVPSPDTHEDGHVVAPAAPPEVVAPPVTAPPVTAPPETVDEPAFVSAATADSDTMAVVAGVGAAVLLAAGVAGAVDARRRRRLRAAAVQARLATPTPRLADLDRLVRHLDAGDRIARLDIALRALGHAVFAHTPGTVMLGAIDAPDGTIDVLLDRCHSDAPQPWVRVTGHRWRLPAAVSIVDLAPAARHAQQPCPALVQLGGTPLDDGSSGQLYLDLEAIGVLAVDAPPATAVAIVRCIAASLAVSPLAESAHLITCGLGDVDLGHAICEHPPNLSAALDAARRAVGATSTATAGLATFVLRSRQAGGEAWEPAIIVAAPDAEDTVDGIDDAQLLAAAPGGQGIGIVVGRRVSGATWTLSPAGGVDGRGWTLHPLGLDVVPVGVTAGELADLQRLLDAADALVLDPDPEPERGPAREPAAAPLRWSLMVRVLGPVEVVDQHHRPAAFERSKALELVVWMSQHREHSTRTGARTALWETTVRDATFANVVSDARRSLARLVAPAEGEEWIGRTLTDELPLHPDVVTDADVLADCVRRAAGAVAADAIDILREGLALVRDMPFAGTSYLWPDSEGTTSALILAVTSAATQLAGLYLAAGDVTGVFWATGQGLKVLPGHEELISLRMRAHGRQGDLAGVRHEWESYERVLDADTWSDGAAPSPKLVALRRELLAPSLSDV